MTAAARRADGGPAEHRVDGEVVERFRLRLAERLGLAFDDAQRARLADVLEQRLAATGLDAERWLGDLGTGAPGDDADAVIARVTVGETYFLRHADQIHAFRDAVLPELVRSRTADRRLHLLSAGCASGEEPYTLAMLTRHLVEAGWAVEVRAVDLNPEAIARARTGRFATWSLRETPPEARRAWFRTEGREHVLDGRLRAAVTFQRASLLDDDDELWAPERWDVVFCRNVLMYLTPEAAATVVARIDRALVPEGHLFLGHAETLRGRSHEFDLCHTHGAFYYRRRGRTGAAADGAPVAAERLDPSAIAAAVGAAASWVDAIRTATDRVHELTGPGADGAGAGSAPAGDGPARAELGTPLRLLSEERFGDALDAVHALPAPNVDDPDVLLLHGVLLVHTGHLDRAEETARRLLAVDDLHAGAHYVLALCREAAGDAIGAVEHDQMAAHLDPAFAMPRLHLGLLARRAGAGEDARRELCEAVALLQEEDAARVLMFGGGFSREALVALAHGELLAIGGVQ